MKVVVVEAGETLPTESVAVALAPCAPSARIEDVKVQSPEPFAVAVPAAAPSMETVTVASASAAPEIVGVLSPVVEPSTGSAMVGAVGAVASTVKLLMVETCERLPTASVQTTSW